MPAGTRSLGQAGLPCGTEQCGTECCDEAGSITRRSQKATLGHLTHIRIWPQLPSAVVLPASTAFPSPLVLLSTTWRLWQWVHAVQGNLITVINHTTASLGGMKFSLHWRCSKPSARVVAAPGGLGWGECVGSVGLSAPRAGMCQVPHATSFYPTELCDLTIVRRGHAPSRHRMVMVALQPTCTGSSFALFCFFFPAMGPAKLGWPGTRPLGGAVCPATYSEDRVGRPLRGGDPAGDGSSCGGLWGHPPLPILLSLQKLYEAPSLPSCSQALPAPIAIKLQTHYFNYVQPSCANEVGSLVMGLGDGLLH